MPSSRASTAGCATNCLNETLFTSLAQARAALEAWRDDYNTDRPHSALGKLTPSPTPIATPLFRNGRALRYPRAPRPGLSQALHSYREVRPCGLSGMS